MMSEANRDESRWAYQLLFELNLMLSPWQPRLSFALKAKMADREDERHGWPIGQHTLGDANPFFQNAAEMDFDSRGADWECASDVFRQPKAFG
jgi:hypothetical protein